MMSRIHLQKLKINKTNISYRLSLLSQKMRMVKQLVLLKTHKRCLNREMEAKINKIYWNNKQDN